MTNRRQSWQSTVAGVYRALVTVQSYNRYHLTSRTPVSENSHVHIHKTGLFAEQLWPNAVTDTTSNLYIASKIKAGSPGWVCCITSNKILIQIELNFWLLEINMHYLRGSTILAGHLHIPWGTNVIILLNVAWGGVPDPHPHAKFGVGEGLRRAHLHAKFHCCGFKYVGLQPPISPKLVIFGINLPQKGNPLKQFLQNLALGAIENLWENAPTRETWLFVPWKWPNKKIKSYL